MRACQYSSSGSRSYGFRTKSPASQALPWPPLSGNGRAPDTPNAVSAAGGGDGTGRNYPTRQRRPRLILNESAPVDALNIPGDAVRLVI